MDLRGWDFSRDGIVSLNGDWEFYRNRLLPTRDGVSPAPPPEYIRVPGRWNDLGSESGNPMGKWGYGSYRLVVWLDEPDRQLAIRFPGAFMSSRLFVNGKELGSAGVPAADEQAYEPKKLAYSAVFEPNGGKLEIMVQAANYDHAIGGIGRALQLGYHPDIQRAIGADTAKEAGIVMVLLVFGVFFLIVYTFHIRNVPFLIFSLFLLCFAASRSMSGEQLLLQFTELEFEWAWRSKNALIFATVPLLYALTVTMYPTCKYKLFPAIPAIAAGGYSAALLLFPFRHAIAAEQPMLYVMILFHGLQIVFLLANYSAANYAAYGKGDFRIFTAAMLCLFVFRLHSIASVRFFQNTERFEPLYIYSFLVIICCLIIYRYQRLYKLTERLGREAAAHEFAFLQSQIKPHFIYNTLGTIMTLCYTDARKAGRLIAAFSQYLRTVLPFDHTRMAVPVSRELELVNVYAEIERERFGARLQVRISADPTLLHCRIFLLTIQPLVENAIRHGVTKKVEGGTVWLTIAREGEWMKIVVEDDGVGMPERKRALLAGGEPTTRGIGLANVHKRVLQMNGLPLQLESTEGRGTTVTLMLPARRRIDGTKGEAAEPGASA